MLRRASASLLAAALASCGGGDEDAERDAEAEAAAAGPPPVWEAPAGAAPRLSLSLNDAADLELHRGWPLIVRAAVLHPAAFEAAAEAAPLAIASAGLELRVADAAGAAQAWPLHRAEPAAAELTLAPGEGAEAAWWLDGSETAALAEGRYVLRLALAVPEAVSPPARLHVGAEPAPLSPERAREKRLLELALLRLRGDDAGARAAVDALLAEDPGDLAALEASGDLYAAAGQPRDALGAYSRALRLFFERMPRPEEPPAELLRKQGSVLEGAVVPE
jgi:hypothetical protein